MVDMLCTISFILFYYDKTNHSVTAYYPDAYVYPQKNDEFIYLP